MNSFKRYFFTMVSVIMVSFTVLGSAFMLLSYRYIVSEKKVTLKEHAVFVSGMASRILDQDLSPDEVFDAGMTALVTVEEEDVLVCGADGTVWFAYSEDENIQVKKTSLPQEFVEQVQKEGVHEEITDLSLYSRKKLAVAVPIYLKQEDSGADMAGVAVVASGVESFERLWHAMSALYLGVALVVLCVAFVTCWFASRQSVRPLNEMTGVVRRFGLGEYDLRVEEKHAARKDEVGELARAFNAMADSIATAEQRRQELISNISHELKTPMTTIQGFADGILDGTVTGEQEENALRVISDETRRLSRLVRRMLDASRLAAKTQEGQVRPQSKFDLNETIARVIISLERKITQRGLDMDVQLPDGALLVWGDMDSITQVCYNLLDNAAKFAASGTAIIFTVTTKGSKVYVSVSNHGATIPAEELPLVFERFHKSDQSRSLDKEGVGLGLYIVKTILNGIQENITVTSVDGLTTFTFTLTRAE